MIEPISSDSESAPILANDQPSTGPDAGAAWFRWRPDWALVIMLLLSGLILGSTGGIIVYFSQVMPEIEQLSSYRPALSTRVYADDGSVFAEFATEKRVLLPLKSIPDRLQRAFLAIEDDQFYDHIGVRPLRIVRAAITNFQAGRIRGGGSTITQQLARNLFLSFERTYSRKIREALLALQIERKYSKEEILELYLNQIYLGAGYNGVGMAARGYFNKDVNELTLAECALLAALPKAPNSYSPRHNMDKALRRRNLVLGRMHDLDWITDAQYQEAVNEPITLSAPTNAKADAGYFGEYVRQIIHRDYGYDKLYRSGLRVEATIDKDLQEAAERAIAQGLEQLEQQRAEEYDARRLRDLRRAARARAIEYEEMSRAALEEELADAVPPAVVDNKPIQAALLAVDAQTGAIRAMVGGRDFLESEFNRATQAKRQMGSIFKPVVWATALERGWTPSDTVVDSPIVFHYKRDGETKEWLPENYEERFYGPTTLRVGLEHSRNIVAIKLLNEIGIGNTVRLARRMGIQSYLDRNLTLALGSSSATLMEVVGAYTAFAHHGIAVEPYAINRITGADGEVVYEHLPTERIAITDQTAYLMTTLLEAVVQQGTAERTLGDFGRPIAGKTGTTDDCTDAWFVGYTPDLVCGVWVGYDQVQPLGDKWTGGRVAAPIWRDFMTAALKDAPAHDFEVPPDIVFKEVEANSGLLAPDGLSSHRRVRQAFVRGTEPQEEYDPSKAKAQTTYRPVHLYESELSGPRL